MFKPVLIILSVSTVFAPPPLDTRNTITNSVHVKAIPLERDGDRNVQFRQEVILSADEEIDISNTKKLGEAIEKMFNATDFNSDGFLTADELQTRIERNTRQHLAKSTQQAIDEMKKVDTDLNGFVSWEEFLQYSTNHVDDKHRDEHGNHVLRTDEAIRLEDEKRSFRNSDDNNDGQLDSNEWLSFLHPEHSKRGLLKISEEILTAYDKNNDSIVSREEFIDFSSTNVDDSNPDFEKMEEEERIRRQFEFDDDIDMNKDGKATIAELFEYVNPKNIRQAKSEVHEIMLLADSNNDGKLSLVELLDRDWLLATSALLSAGRRLHDEM